MRISPESAAVVAAIVDAGSLEAAAFALRVTPSAVSQRLKGLEQQLGRVLIIRGRPATATAAGEAIVRMARQLALLEHDALTGIGADAGEGARVTVPLAVNADSMATWFLAPLARVAAERDIDFDLHRDDQDFTAGLLESGTVMAAVTSQSVAVPGCSVTALGALGYQAAATPAFVERWFPDGVDAASLRRAPFVDFDRRDSLQHDWLATQGVDAQGIPRHYVPASHDFAQAVMLGLGWGMVPLLQGSEALSSGVLHPLGGERVSVPLFWQQWNLRSELLEHVASEIADEAARALEG